MSRFTRSLLFGLLLVFLLHELKAWFFVGDVDSAIGSSQDAQLRINLNITTPALSCEHASVSVLDLLHGNKKLLMAKDIEKWNTDAKGVKRGFHSKDETPLTDQRDSPDDEGHVVPLTSATLEEFVQDNDNVMVHFYEPSVPRSKDLALTWEAFAEKMEHAFDGSVIVAKVDCTRDLCNWLKIRSFPTVRFYKSGLPMQPDYEGERDVDSLVQYATATARIKVGGDGNTPSRSEDVWHVVQLTGANFKYFLERTDYVMVHFHASWARRSQRMEPTWEVFADAMGHSFDGRMRVATVDCVAERSICETQHISVFPTVRFFKSGVADEEDYNNDRDLNSLVQFATVRIVEAENALRANYHRVQPATEDGSPVIELTTAAFEEFLESNEYVMVDFYAPWCVWCKKLAPTWEGFAEEMEHSPYGVRVAKVDCVAERDLCATQNLLAFPTLRFFKSGVAVEPDYSKDREVSSLMKYATATVEEEKALRRSEDGQHVVPLTNETFKAFVGRNDYVMVYFCAPWSSRCKELAPIWEAFAEEVEQTLDGSMRVAKVDCVAEQDLCERQDLMAFPTVTLYKSGVANKPNYGGQLDVPNLVRYATARIGGEGALTRPEDGQHVVQLTDEAFKALVDRGDTFIVRFHVPWAPDGKLDVTWEAFATEVNFFFDGSMTVAKVDCVAERDLCLRENITDWEDSTIRVYKSGLAEEADYADQLDMGSLLRYATAKMRGRAQPQRRLSRVEQHGIPETHHGIHGIQLTYKDGWPMIELTDETFKEFVESNKHVVVDFYAPWCVWSNMLEPIWQAFAEEMEYSVDSSMRVAKVDCVAEADLCSREKIRAFPTMRFFKSGWKDGADYMDERDVPSLVKYTMAKTAGDENTPLRRSEDGQHLVHLTGATFNSFVGRNDDIMVHFHAPWAVWSTRMEPEWEAFSQEMGNSLDGNMRVATVDCVAERDICSKQHIKAYPTVRFYKSGVADEADYADKRNMASFMRYAASKMGGNDGDVGCQLSGSIIVNRMLGNFHIKAAPEAPNIGPAAVNVSHVVNSLDFETQLPAIGQREWTDTGVPLEELSALGDRVHTIQVVLVPASAEDTGATEESDNARYQMVFSSHTTPPFEDKEPVAHFFYDFRAMSVYKKQGPRKWSDSAASLLAWALGYPASDSSARGQRTPPHAGEDPVSYEDLMAYEQGGYDDRKGASTAAEEALPGKHVYTGGPDFPRRGRSAYVLFSMEAREGVKDGLPEGSKVTAVMKGIAAKWRALDEDEKAVWKAKADEDRKRYEQELSVYDGPIKVPNRLALGKTAGALDSIQPTKPRLGETHPEGQYMGMPKIQYGEWTRMSEKERPPYQTNNADDDNDDI